MLLLLINAFANEPLPSNRAWDVLTPADHRTMTREAGVKLGDWSVEVAGVALDGRLLVELAATAPEEPWTRVLREQTRRPMDPEDLLYFLDDVLAAEERRGEDICVTSGRARGEGILLHPDDVFDGKPRRYGLGDSVAVDRPLPPEEHPPAADGAVLGPDWSARYENPVEYEDHLASLREARPTSDFADRVRSLLDQLQAQGAEVYITSAVRSRHRGYLMWGASLLSQQTSQAGVEQSIAKLNAANTEWKLDTPIAWAHPDGWEATVEEARRMADAYGVVYATENGARWSKHYTGVACDFIALALPRTLTLEAPDGVSSTFDLSDPDESRDLSLSPALIGWVEQHFSMKKLKSDYPHWDDSR